MSTIAVVESRGIYGPKYAIGLLKTLQSTGNALKLPKMIKMHDLIPPKCDTITLEQSLEPSGTHQQDSAGRTVAGKHSDLHPPNLVC